MPTPTTLETRAHLLLAADTLRTATTPDHEGDAGSLISLITRDLEALGHHTLANLLQGAAEADGIENRSLATLCEMVRGRLPL